jgi:hypothetical protein
VVKSPYEHTPTLVSPLPPNPIHQSLLLCSSFTQSIPIHVLLLWMDCICGRPAGESSYDFPKPNVGCSGWYESATYQNLTFKSHKSLIQEVIPAPQTKRYAGLVRMAGLSKIWLGWCQTLGRETIRSKTGRRPFPCKKKAKPIWLGLFF